MSTQPPTITPSTYYSHFESSEVGRIIMDDLTSRFYDIEAYVKGDPHDTAFNEGKRAVVRYIIKQILQGGQMAPPQSKDKLPRGKKAKKVQEITAPEYHPFSSNQSLTNYGEDNE